MANWVSAGCGVIANELAQAMEKRGQKLYGVVNRTQEKAVAFAEKYGVQKVYTSFEEACEDPAVDIIYISCLLYTSPSPRDKRQSRMPSSA